MTNQLTWFFMVKKNKNKKIHWVMEDGKTIFSDWNVKFYTQVHDNILYTLIPVAENNLCLVWYLHKTIFVIIRQPPLRMSNADEYTHVTWNVYRVRKCSGSSASLDVLFFNYGLLLLLSSSWSLNYFLSYSNEATSCVLLTYTLHRGSVAAKNFR